MTGKAQAYTGTLKVGPCRLIDKCLGETWSNGLTSDNYWESIAPDTIVSYKITDPGTYSIIFSWDSKKSVSELVSYIWA